MKPYILITNDDGIHAHGIRHLCNALKGEADLVIVAPATEQSAAGLSITIRDPLHISKVEWGGETEAWSLSGTPADCVKIALGVLLKRKPDLVLSGINKGTNAGRNILYSGTVGGTIEAVMNDIPGIAFSCWEYFDPDYHSTTRYIPLIVKDALQHPLPKGTLLNVNFPTREIPIKGFKLARQGMQYWAADPDERVHPAEGHKYFWLGAKLMEFEEHEESDIAWLRQGYATAAPIHVEELTDHAYLRKHKERIDTLLSHI